MRVSRGLGLLLCRLATSAARIELAAYKHTSKTSKKAIKAAQGALTTHLHQAVCAIAHRCSPSLIGAAAAQA